MVKLTERGVEVKAIVFGGSSGMGKAIATQIICEGHEVCICSHNAQKLANTHKELALMNKGRVTSLQIDLANQKSIQVALPKISANFGTPDALVLNGGGPPPGRFKDITLAQWKKTLSEHYLSSVAILQHFIPKMQKPASVVFILSDVVRASNKNLVVSSSIRLGIIGLIKCLAQDYAEQSIRFNAVSPGSVATDRARQLFEDCAKREGITSVQAQKNLTDRLVMKRMGSPEEIAELVYFLLSPKSSYISGINIVADGANNTFPG